jgi:ribosomal peptide maturation radical SAM protein 1
MRVALVSMPWLDGHVPSAALAALKAWVAAHVPGCAGAVWPAHVEVARRLGRPVYRAIQEDPLAGEALYAGLVYPEGRDGLFNLLGAAFAADAAKTGTAPPPEADPAGILGVIDAHAAELAGRLAATADVVGLAATFHQLFANVLLGRRIKALNPSVFIVWGGSLLRGAAGPSFLREYTEIDAIVQGEGEYPLEALLGRLAAGQAPPDGVPGLLTRGNLDRFPAGAPVWEADDVAALPLPDFDDYAAAADPLSVEWRVWLQTARGCWWDRSGTTGDPKRRCLFCNMNERRRYRAKPARQVAAEVAALVARHANPRVVLGDLCMRPTGLADLGRRLAAPGRQLQLQIELRAGARPRDVVALWEAGLAVAHTGVEGFSTAYLRRMNKGTTVIQNLELLKTCAELEIGNPFGLVTDFPGSTAAEVAESVANIEAYATAYPPPGFLHEFDLTAGSAVDMLRGEFGVEAVRNHPRYAEFLPAGVRDRLVLPHRVWAYTPAGRPADWTPVREACRRWRAMHEEIRAAALREGRTPPKALVYLDGGDFLEITDHRDGTRRLTLSGMWRDVYLECLETRAFADLERRFTGAADAARLRGILDRLVAERVMFAEDGRYLALALATRPDIAARRMKGRSKK